MIVIVGAGYAGGATAWMLARRGRAEDVILLETEPAPGWHASGKNAGLMTGLLEEDPVMAAMAARGATLLHESFGPARCGSILLVPDEQAAGDLVLRASELGVPVETAGTADLAREHPWLAGAPCPIGVRCPDDAVVEPDQLALWYVDQCRQAGVRVVSSARVTSVLSEGGRVIGVETPDGRFGAEWVVDAGGAWAGTVARMAGLGDLGLASYRRHLFVSGPIEGADPMAPFVWDLERQVYFRPMGDRLLLCMCDEDPHPPGEPEVSFEAHGKLSLAIQTAFPALAAIPIQDARACLRTFAPDRRYVVGPDPRLPGFFWVAGLGGSGAVAGAAVGELAAALLLGDAIGSAPGGAGEFAPARLIEPEA